MVSGSDARRSQEVLSVLCRFCRRLNDRLDRFADPVNSSVFPGGTGDPKLVHIFEKDVWLEAHMVGQKPHRFVSRFLVEPCFEALGYRYIPEPRGDRVEAQDIYPDFRVVADGAGGGKRDQLIIGELKPVGNLTGAVTELREEYLMELSPGSFGVATDGLTWRLFRRSAGSVEKMHPGHVSLRTVLHDIRKPMVHSRMEPKDDAALQNDLSWFVEVFGPPLGRVDRDKTLDQF